MTESEINFEVPLPYNEGVQTIEGEPLPMQPAEEPAAAQPQQPAAKHAAKPTRRPSVKRKPKAAHGAPAPAATPAPAPKPAGAKRGKKRYIPAIDGLRAFAVFAVILYHMGMPFARGGLLGVTVFFVISGYLITGLLTAEWDASGTINLPQFWFRRIRRLFPAIVLVIVVTAAVFSFASPLLLTKMRPDIIPGLFWFENWWYIFRDLSYFEAAGAPSPLTHFWSLAIEEQFYLVWPVLLLGAYKAGAKKKLVRRACLVLAVISAIAMAVLFDPAGDPSRVYYGTDTRAFSLLIGAWLSFAWPGAQLTEEGTRHVPRKSVAILDGVGIAAFLAIIAMCVFISGYSMFMYYGGLLICSILSAVVIAVLAHPRSMLARFAALKPFVWIGQRSYGMYLWHFPIIVLLQPRNATALPWWIYLVEIALTIGIAHLSYQYVETPIRRDGFIAFFKKLRDRAPALVASGLVTVVAVGGILVVPPVAEGGIAVDEPRVMSATLKKPIVDGVYDVVFVGDSVSLGANEQLNEAFPHGLIDTEGNRQIEAALPVLQDYIDQGIVGDTVMISLSTNGFAKPEELEQIMSMCGPDRTVWFVNIRVPDERCEPNNAAIQACVDAHDNAHLIDWYATTAGHDEYLIDDGIHLTVDGRKAFADLVVSTMGYVAPNDENTKYDVLFIGDVVALDAIDELSKKLPNGALDCSDARDFKAVRAAFDKYAEKNVIGDTLVLSLGNEGLLDRNDVEQLITDAGADKIIWIVNARCPNMWCEQNNELLSDIASKHDNVHIIDWFEASKGHDEYLAENGMGLTEDGVKAYTDTITHVMGL